MPEYSFLCFVQIKMSTETANRVGSLLHSSPSQGEISVNGPSGSGQGNRQTSASVITSKPVAQLEPDNVNEKEKLSLQLKEKQEKMKVHTCISYFLFRLMGFVGRFIGAIGYL